MIKKLGTKYLEDMKSICYQSLDEDTFNDGSFFEKYFTENGHCYGYFSNSTLQGFIYYIHYDSYTYVMLIAVTPEYQNTGVGSMLLKKVIFSVKQDLFAIINKNNKNSIKLFEKFQFCRIWKKEVPNELKKNYRTDYYPYKRQKYIGWGYYDIYREIQKKFDFSI